MAMNHNKVVLFITFWLCLLLPVSGNASEGAAKKPDGKKPEKNSKFKTYSGVITEEAKTEKGIFTVHMVDDKVYYEISPKVCGKEFLWVASAAKTQTGYGYGGSPVAQKVVRWERKGDNILLRQVTYKIQAKKGSAEAIAVKASNLPAVLASYKILCFSGEEENTGNPVIEVTKLFTGDLEEFSPKRMLDAASIDSKRSFIDWVKSFPKNIETRVLLTFRPKPQAPGQPFSRGRNDKSISLELHHSMVMLPEKPMMPRFLDKRVGYFNQVYQDYSGGNLQKVNQVAVIQRFRLEKKDPQAALSEPITPIVFYIGREVPEKYRPWVKSGIEAWNVAFEQAGFRNAIVGKYAPGLKEDPRWDPEDARYASIRWFASTVLNARGPRISDPRSGEILDSDIQLHHNVLKLVRDWYFTQASPNDPKAQKLPFSDELMGKMLEFVVTHEVGHAIGLHHNFKASSGMTVSQVRDRAFTAKYSHTPSIMDYGRFNYVAQPGDGANLIPFISSYDKFAIEWGYRPFPSAKTPEAERPFLNEIAARQLNDPKLRFGISPITGPVSAGDHTIQAEDLSSDAIEATGLGLKNLERIMGFLVEGTSRSGENYDELAGMYNEVLTQLRMEMGHVAHMVGSIEVHNKVHGMEGDFYTPLDVAKQKAAVAFLQENIFKFPRFFLQKDLLKRIGMHDINKRVGEIHNRLLSALLSSDRADRISDLEASGYDTYRVSQMVGDLSKGIFSEFSQGNSKVGPLRRNLQRMFVKKLLDNLDNDKVNGDLKAASHFQLAALAKTLNGYSSEDRTTEAHVSNLYEKIQRELN
jgi:hypothetical protein